MFFSSTICRADIVETLRFKNPITECAQNLRKECENYSFNLDDSNCNPRDVANSLNQYSHDKPPMWEMFFNNLFPQRSRSENIIRQCDTIFQIVFNLVHNCRKNVPLHIGFFCFFLFIITCTSTSYTKIKKEKIYIYIYTYIHTYIHIFYKFVKR